MNYNDLPLSKAQQRKKRKPAEQKPPKVPESAIQKQLDDMLEAYGIWTLRVPDSFFKWVKMRTPAGIQACFFRIFGGIPDNLAMLKLTDKYMLCCPIEAKSLTGKRHGKQKHWESQGIPFQITRGTDDSVRIIEQFITDFEHYKKLIHEKGTSNDKDSTHTEQN